MVVTIAYFSLAIVLFCLSFFAKRRFGLLGLALASGSVLSGIWGYDASLIASGIGLPSNKYVDAVVLAVIILLPAVILLFHGYKYRTLAGRVAGAILFTILALALLLVPLGGVWAPIGVGSSVFTSIKASDSFIIGTCLIVAVVDLFLVNPAVNSKRRR